MSQIEAEGHAHDAFFKTKGAAKGEKMGKNDARREKKWEEKNF